MFVHEPVIVPDLKTSGDARHYIPVMALFDRGLIVVVLAVDRTVDVVVPIDDVDPV